MKEKKLLAKCKCCDAKLFISNKGQYFVMSQAEGRNNITKEEAIEYVRDMRNIPCPGCAEDWLVKNSKII